VRARDLFGQDPSDRIVVQRREGIAELLIAAAILFSEVPSAACQMLRSVHREVHKLLNSEEMLTTSAAVSPRQQVCDSDAVLEKMIVSY
jgi:hypothetical protein